MDPVRGVLRGAKGARTYVREAQEASARRGAPTDADGQDGQAIAVIDEPSNKPHPFGHTPLRPP
jgi:hypothetical protein